MFIRRIVVAFVLLTTVLAAQGKAPNGMRKGNWRPQDVPDGYVVKRVGKYQIQSNCSADDIARVGKHMNRMLKVYSKFAPTSRTPKGRMVIKLFQTREEFLAYGQTPSAVAYYSPSDKEMVGYHTGQFAGVISANVPDDETPPSDTLGVFAHEGWHQYFDFACPSEIEFPAWIDEGVAEYFCSAWIDNKKMVVGAPLDEGIPAAKAAALEGELIPLEKFVFYDQEAYYSGDTGLNYSQGWFLCHFFLEHPTYKKKKYVQRFYKIFLAEHSIKKTVTQVFGRRMDWAGAETDFEAWIRATPDPEEMDKKKIAASRKALDALPPKTKKALEACIAKGRKITRLKPKKAGK